MIYSWLTLKKNPCSDMKMIKISTWSKICEMTCEIGITNLINIKNHFNFFWSMFSFLNTQL
jgi:hypothetical protein